MEQSSSPVMDLVEGTIVHAAQLIQTASSAVQVARYAHDTAPKVTRFLRREENRVPTIAYIAVGAGLLGWALVRGSHSSRS